MHPWFIALPWVHYLSYKTKECYHTTRFEKATRYYVIRLERDLLGDWTLFVTNGRIKSKLGQSRIIAFECFFDAYEHFCLMAKERYQRGYYVASFYTEDFLYQIIMLFTLVTKNPAIEQKVKRTASKKQNPIQPQQMTINASQFLRTQQMSLIF